MAFDISRYEKSVTRLASDDIDFDAFRSRPLAAPVLRCLRYMHDVEHHTVCYLRDLLVTRAHRDPEVTTFLTLWNYEEHWHGAAIGEVLLHHDEPANIARIASMRSTLTWRDQIHPVASQVGSLLTPHFVAINMSWGAVNEWTTQASYARLIEAASHPVLTQLLRRIMRQEGRHIDFYMSQATTRLQASPCAQRLTRRALSRFWDPVGAGVMPKEEVCFLVSYLFGDDSGRAAAARIDRQIDRLPGLSGLGLVERAAIAYKKAA